MIIRCPNCSTTYKVSGSVFDEPRPTFRCTRCKHIFMVRVSLQLTEEETAPAADPKPEARVAGRPPDAGDEPDPGRPGEARDRDVLGDDIPLPEVEATRVAPEPSDETLEADTESAARDSADADMDDGDFRDAGRADPEFVIDTVEGELPEGELPEERPTGSAEQAAVIDGDLPLRDKRRPDFEIEDDFLLPPGKEPKPAPRPRADARGSIVPLVSLVGLAIFAFVLVTLIYQANPQPLDSLIRRIPWYGSTIFENRHFKHTLTFESLVSGVQPVLNQTDVFIVSGKLTNRNDRNVHKIQIEAQLFDAEGKQIGRQVTFVGNAISAKIIQDMTLREITLLQSLKSTYQIAPDQSANFTIVFPKPKVAVASFGCRVVSADFAG